MPRNVIRGEHSERFEDAAKLEWLRAAAKEGFEATERGDCVSLDSDEEIDDFVDQIRREVTAKLRY